MKAAPLAPTGPYAGLPSGILRLGCVWHLGVGLLTAVYFNEAHDVAGKLKRQQRGEIRIARRHQSPVSDAGR